MEKIRIVLFEIKFGRPHSSNLMGGRILTLLQPGEAPVREDASRSGRLGRSAGDPGPVLPPETLGT